jgi:hypothetical protein
MPALKTSTIPVSYHLLRIHYGKKEDSQGVLNTIVILSSRPLNPGVSLDGGTRSQRWRKISSTSRFPNPKQSAAARMNLSLRVQEM